MSIVACSFAHSNHRFFGVFVLAGLVMLAGCSATSPTSISLPGTKTSVTNVSPSTSIGDLRTEHIRWNGVKPGCQGECPTIEIDSVAFPDIPALTQQVDHTLASLTGIDQNLRGQYKDLSQFIQYFWRTAHARDAVNFVASVKDVVSGVIVVELHTYQYFTGQAHGIPATVYLNWQSTTGSLLHLDDLIIPGRKPEFVNALKAAHQRWLVANEDAQHDRALYDRTWPFQETDNVALTREGLIAKYDAYAIAPYAQGEPEILLPYANLRGILKPTYLPGS